MLLSNQLTVMSIGRLVIQKFILVFLLLSLDRWEYFLKYDQENHDFLFKFGQMFFLYKEESRVKTQVRYDYERSFPLSLDSFSAWNVVVLWPCSHNGLLPPLTQRNMPVHEDSIWLYIIIFTIITLQASFFFQKLIVFFEAYALHFLPKILARMIGF